MEEGTKKILLAILTVVVLGPLVFVGVYLILISIFGFENHIPLSYSGIAILLVIITISFILKNIFHPEEEGLNKKGIDGKSFVIMFLLGLVFLVYYLYLFSFYLNHICFLSFCLALLWLL